MKTKVLVGLLAVVGVSAVAPMAYADPTKKDDSYGYIFTDDPLQAEGKNANTAHNSHIEARFTEELRASEQGAAAIRKVLLRANPGGDHAPAMA